jgi:hypothetical protein
LDVRIIPQFLKGLNLLLDKNSIVLFPSLPDIILEVLIAKDDEVGVCHQQLLEEALIVLVTSLELDQISSFNIVYESDLRIDWLVSIAAQSHQHQEA